MGPSSSLPQHQAVQYTSEGEPLQTSALPLLDSPARSPGFSCRLNINTSRLSAHAYLVVKVMCPCLPDGQGTVPMLS